MFAPMRLFTGVGTDMDSQGAALDETLVAVSPSADVWTVIGVYAIVSDEVRLAIEFLSSEVDGSAWEDDHVMNEVYLNYLWA